MLSSRIVCTQQRSQTPVPHYSIAPRKVSPGFLLVNYRPGGDFSGARFYNGKTFRGASNILIKGRHINSLIISPRADFSWWRHFNVTPAAVLYATACRRLQTGASHQQQQQQQMGADRDHNGDCYYYRQEPA